MGRKGAFWLRAAMVVHLARLNPRTSDLLDLDRLKQKIGFVRPIIGTRSLNSVSAD